MLSSLVNFLRSFRYIIGFALAIALLIFAIVLIVHHGGGKNKLPATQKPLISYASDDNFMVKETVDGQINAPQDHNQLQITVTNQATSFELLKGYEGSIVSQEQYPMTQTSYSVFLNALEHADFTKGDASASNESDRGYCPEGQRYMFEAMENGKDIERFWSTSCGAPKTFKGNAPLVLGLFQAQVPDYDSLIQNYTNGADFAFHF